MSKFNNLDNPGHTRRILEVRVYHPIDEDPDLSHLGEYSNSPDPRFCIDRKERGQCERGQYRFFNPSRNYDDCGMDELKKYAEQDYARMEEYNRGTWCAEGVRAMAKVQLGSTLIQTLESGGLWGIESDSDKGYFQEVEDEQLEELRFELQACGFTPNEINAAFAEVKRP